MGVTVSDFTLSSDSAGGESTSTSTGQFTQTRSPHLTIPDLATVSDTITVSSSGTVASVSVTVDITHTYIGDLKIDIIAPDGTSITLHDNSGGSTVNIDQPYAPLFGSIPISGVWTLQIHDRDAPDPGVLNSWTLTINYSTTTTVSPVTDISGSGDVYYVTVSALQDGIYNLDLVSSGHGITDAAANPLTNTTPTTGIDQTYTVRIIPPDNTVPTLVSIQRSSPAVENTGSQTLVYEVTFSEDVTVMCTM
jgi:subtilisin-like proprotein convertase family protein